MSFNLTRRQKSLYDFIVAYFDDHGYAPSFEEMKGACGLQSKSGVHRMIVALEERGKIRRLPNRSRSIQPIVEDNIFLRLPTELLWRLNVVSSASGVSINDIVMRAIVRELPLPTAVMP